MRQIKFRAWDKTPNHGFWYWSAGDTDFDLSKELQKGVMPINQYTGLKDKNGKEIYEGDILFRRSDDCFIKDVHGARVRIRGEQGYYEVVWRQGGLDDDYDSYYGKVSCVGFALKEIKGRFMRKVDIDVVPVPTLAGREWSDPIIQNGGIYSIFTSTHNKDFEVIGNIYENPELLAKEE